MCEREKLSFLMVDTIDPPKKVLRTLHNKKHTVYDWLSFNYSHECCLLLILLTNKLLRNFPQENGMIMKWKCSKEIKFTLYIKICRYMCSKIIKY